MTPKIFITGATGYIGGDALYALQKAHPEYDYTALVRNSDKGALVAASYPTIRLVYGTLDDADLVTKESSQADIVLHTADASDHVVGATAIAKGLAAGHSKEKPGFYIHTSGTAILTWKDMEIETYGEAPSQIPYDDLDRVEDLTALPDKALHRDVDKIVLGAASDITKTAIICPPTIYGPGRGPGNRRSMQVYNLAQITLKNGQAPMLGKGLTEWDNVNVNDLSDLYVLLVEAAVSYKDKAGIDSEIWGPKAYFLAENGHHTWGEVAKQIAKVAADKGYIENKDVKDMSPEEGEQLYGFQALTWGLNSKGFAKRARKYLGWKPKGRNLVDELPFIVDSEAQSLGKKTGHAKKAAGKN